jgi:hypothetical protein
VTRSTSAHRVRIRRWATSLHMQILGKGGVLKEATIAIAPVAGAPLGHSDPKLDSPISEIDELLGKGVTAYGVLRAELVLAGYTDDFPSRSPVPSTISAIEATMRVAIHRDADARENLDRLSARMAHPAGRAARVARVLSPLAGAH